MNINNIRSKKKTLIFAIATHIKINLLQKKYYTMII